MLTPASQAEKCGSHFVYLRQHALLLETLELLFVISFAVRIDARGFLEKVSDSRCVFIARRLAR
jgi:hypothetical protein